MRLALLGASASVREREGGKAHGEARDADHDHGDRWGLAGCIVWDLAIDSTRDGAARKWHGGI